MLETYKNRTSFVSLALVALIIWIYHTYTQFCCRNNDGWMDLDSITKAFNLFYFTNNYSIEPSPMICNKKPFLVMLVTSSVGHVELRNAHRRAIPKDLLIHFNAVRVFLLAAIRDKLNSSISQEAIEEENKTFGDILQGSFLDRYRHLTHKTMMGLDWASSTCKNATFILKVDDDVVFNLYATYALLLKWNVNLTDKESFLLGYQVRNSRPHRFGKSRAYVSPAEFIHFFYPIHLSGGYYITTPETAYRIVKCAVGHHFLALEDVFITGRLKNHLNITLKQIIPTQINFPLDAEICISYMVKNYVIPMSPMLGVNFNHDRVSLIEEFYQALERCYIWKNCTMDTRC